MEQQVRTPDRRLVVVGAIMIQLALGAIYAWSVFTARLTDPAGVYAFSASQAAWVFSMGLATFAIVMVLAGRILPRTGPRMLSMAGGLLLGAGYVIGGFFGESFWVQLFAIGILSGTGIGLAYVVPIAVCVKWFPDKKGLITGVAVAGFGLGAMIWVKLAGTWGGLIVDLGLGPTFMIYGGIFLLLVVLGSTWMKFPASFVPPEPDQKVSKLDFRSEEMIRTPHYWSIFSTFAIGATAGLMCIGLMKQFPAQALVSSGMSPTAADAAAGTAMVVFAIFNAIGRIGWGKISDMIGHAVNCDHRGRRTSLMAMAASQGVFVVLFPYVAGAEYLLYVVAALIGFNFGGNFALFPAITTDTFGHKYFGQNYGYVFLAYGIGGTVGPMLGGYLGDMNNFVLAFVITGVMSLVAAGIISTVRVPTKLETEEAGAGAEPRAAIAPGATVSD